MLRHIPDRFLVASAQLGSEPNVKASPDIVGQDWGQLNCSTTQLLEFTQSNCSAQLRSAQPIAEFATAENGSQLKQIEKTGRN